MEFKLISFNGGIEIATISTDYNVRSFFAVVYDHGAGWYVDLFFVHILKP